MAEPFARVIDLETTGTPEDEGAEIVEVATVDVLMGARELGEEWSSLVRPRGPIPAVTKAVHHIIESDLEDAPEIGDVWDNIFDGVGEDDFLVAHNAKFEKHFIGAEGQRWIDTYKVARIVYPDAPTHSNQGLRYWLNLGCDREKAFPPHRALPDAYVTAHLFLHLLNRKTPEEMEAISRYPALLKVMNFGKYRKQGVKMTFEECAHKDASYLEWIKNESDMDEDTKFSAHYWLRKRVAG